MSSAAPDAGDRVRLRTVTTADGEQLQFPAAEGLTHLQIRRFAGCPICAEHLRPFGARKAELEAARISELVVFKSEARQVQEHESGLPFDTIADPDAHWYDEFAIRSTPRSLLNLPALAAFLRGVVRSRSLGGSLTLGDHLGLPGDFLLQPDGTIVAGYRGTNAADGWSVDQVLELAREHR